MAVTRTAGLLLAALLVTACTANGDDMDIAEAERTVEHYVDLVVDELGIDREAATVFPFQRGPCTDASGRTREGLYDASLDVQAPPGPVGVEDPFDRAASLLDGEGFAVTDLRPEGRGEVVGDRDGLLVSVLGSLDGDNVTVSGHTGCRPDAARDPA